MKALDTNVIVRFLVNDEPEQAARARTLLLGAEREGQTLFVANAVLLETIWVLSSVFGFTRAELLEALEHLVELPVLRFESYDDTIDLLRLGHRARADLADLIIGLSARRHGCDSTVTFDRRLEGSDLFEQL